MQKVKTIDLQSFTIYGVQARYKSLLLVMFFAICMHILYHHHPVMTDDSNKDYQYTSQEPVSFPIFAGSASDLSELNLDFLGLKFIKFKSDAYMSLFEQVLIPQQEELSREIAGFNHVAVDRLANTWFTDSLYVLIPQDWSTRIQSNTPWLLQHALRVLFPSDFRFFGALNCTLLNKEWLAIAHYEVFSEPPFRAKDNLFEDFAQFDPAQVSEISRFLPQFFDYFTQCRYFRRAVVSYLNSFAQSQLEMAYIRLCISLEAIISGKDELLYRIKRASAIVNGRTLEEGRILVENVKKLYELRSDIVHGSSYDEAQVPDYYPKLRALVSRTLIQLVAFNIPTLKDFNDRLMEAGFGNQQDLCKNYRPFIVNPSTAQEMLMPLKKYKRHEKE